MSRKATVADVILEALAMAQGNGCSFDELIDLCPDLTWNQIFLEVDRLSREGLVQLSQTQPGTYCARSWMVDSQLIGARQLGAVTRR
jgi:hypothetical protein